MVYVIEKNSGEAAKIFEDDEIYSFYYGIRGEFRIKTIYSEVYYFLASKFEFKGERRDGNEISFNINSAKVV